jgi:hypothetical protein
MALSVTSREYRTVDSKTNRVSSRKPNQFIAREKRSADTSDACDILLCSLVDFAAGDALGVVVSSYMIFDIISDLE